MKTFNIALVLGIMLLLAGTSNAHASPTALALRFESNGVYTCNGFLCQTLEPSFGTNLIGLAFTNTTTYDFYTPALATSVSLAAGDEGGGKIFMQNTSTNSSDSFKVTARIQFYDYDPVSGNQTLLVDTTPSTSKSINTGPLAVWEIPVGLMNSSAVLPAGHMIHVAMTIALVAGNPGNYGFVLYNGPVDSSTAAWFPQNSPLPLSWTFITNGTLATPAVQSIAVLPDPGVQINLSGTPGGAYFIQATTNLSAPSWTVIGTNIMDTNGLAIFIDQDATNYPCRFYRTVTP